MFNWTRKIYIPSLVLLSAILAAGITTAESANQDPTQERPPLTDEERRRVMQRLVEQMQKSGENQKQLLGKPAIDTTPAAAGPAAKTPEPAAPVGPAVPAVAQKAAEATDAVQLNYDSVDLYAFVNQVADTLGITPIVIEPEVKGTVTIHSSAPISRQDLFPLFNLILKNNNAALIKQGLIYQIVPTSAGLKKGLEVIEYLPPAAPAKPSTDKKPETVSPNPEKTKEPAQKPAPTAATPANPAAAQGSGTTQAAQTPSRTAPRLATHIIRVEFVPVRDLIEALKLFMTEGGVIMPYERLNMLIVTDYSDSVAKVMEIIRLLDDSYLSADLIELIKIKYNASNDVVDDLRKIFGAGSKEAATGIYFVSLERLNSILIMANSKRALEEVKRWIDRLDATTGRTIQTFIYTVENSTASNIALILSALYGGEGGGTAGTTGDQRSTGGMTTGSFGRSGSQTAGPGGGFSGGTSGSGFGGGGNFGGGGTFGGQSGTFGGGTFGQGGYGGGGFGGGGFSGSTQQLGPRLNGMPSVSAQILRGGTFAGLQGDVRIVVDDINNSLIIQASQADYTYILETIKKMDVQPRQVIIDARIFEVDLTDAFSFGISATLQARTAGEHLTTGKIEPINGALSAASFAFIGNARELLLGLDALRQKTKVRILEAPSVLALDGTVARIVVGGEVPYPGASFMGAAGGATTSVQYRDTGISLIVMPRVSASGTVTLDLAQEISTPGAPTPTGPTFNKTSVSTTLAVKDGDTVAIAGLIRESNNVSRGGIPFLSEIPLLGSLFGRSSRSANRTELLIMITPHVIRTRERFQEMTQELKDSLRNVGRMVDKKNKEFIEDLEDSRERHSKQEMKRQNEEGKGAQTDGVPPIKKEEMKEVKPDKSTPTKAQEQNPPKPEAPAPLPPKP